MLAVLPETEPAKELWRGCEYRDTGGSEDAGGEKLQPCRAMVPKNATRRLLGPENIMETLVVTASSSDGLTQHKVSRLKPLKGGESKGKIEERYGQKLRDTTLQRSEITKIVMN